MSLEEEKTGLDDKLEDTSGLGSLKSHSVRMGNVHLAMFPDFNKDSVPEGAFNDVNGVLMFKTEGDLYAIPSNTKTIEWISNSGLVQREFGVPNLNDANVWGDEARRNQMDSFKEWVGLVSMSEEAERNSIE